MPKIIQLTIHYQFLKKHFVEMRKKFVYVKCSCPLKSFLKSRIIWLVSVGKLIIDITSHLISYHTILMGKMIRHLLFSFIKRRYGSMRWIIHQPPHMGVTLGKWTNWQFRSKWPTSGGENLKHWNSDRASRNNIVSYGGGFVFSIFFLKMKPFREKFVMTKFEEHEISFLFV